MKPIVIPLIFFFLFLPDMVMAKKDGLKNSGSIKSTDELAEKFKEKSKYEIFDYSREIKINRQSWLEYKENYKNRYKLDDRLGKIFRKAHYHIGAWKKYLIEIFRNEFAGSGLPVEMVDRLIYLAIPESHWILRKSPVGAAGYYQFMPRTAKDYDLSCDQHYNIDERLDPLLAGQAAARYLRKLYDMFGSIDLALSRYNGSFSETCLEEAREKNEFAVIDYDDFLDYLERRANILKKDIERLDVYPYRVRKNDTLGGIARVFRVTKRELSEANRLSAGDILKRGMIILIPNRTEGTKRIVFFKETAGLRENFRFAARFWATIELIEEGFVADEEPTLEFEIFTVRQARATRTYLVKPGDSLSRIALRFGVRLSDILKINHLKNSNFIKVGIQLVIPAGMGKIVTLKTVAGEISQKKGIGYHGFLKRLIALNPAVKNPSRPLPEGFRIRY
ncbi:MAG: LysM peptidoglycan-binding domain-containing protein [Candidatus Falkowbacteria bacterium]